VYESFGLLKERRKETKKERKERKTRAAGE
jgi:hypothetical protein